MRRPYDKLRELTYRDADVGAAAREVAVEIAATVYSPGPDSAVPAVDRLAKLWHRD